MRLIAILGLALTLGVLALPRHGTPSERAGERARPAMGRSAVVDAVGPATPARSLGVSLAADHTDPPVQTITITLPPPPKPRRRHVDRSPAATIARISRAVFHARWRTAACIAHYESTDGRYLYNGPSLGPWQINTAAHPWANAWRLVHDWPYSARVAYRISRGGTNWAPWTTHGRCGV